MNFEQTAYIIEQQAAKAKRFPGKLVRISYRNFYLFNAEAGILFNINYNEERGRGDKWDLEIEADREIVDAYPTKLMAATVARNWK